METTVTIWHGTGPDTFHRPYEPGDPITAVFTFPHYTDQPPDPHQLADAAFRMFNDDPHSEDEADTSHDYHFRAGLRSLSIGDVVVIGETALAVDRLGWKPVAIPPTT